MGTRSTLHWAILGYLVSVATLLLGAGLQVSGFQSMLVAWAMVILALIALAIAVFLSIKWYREDKRQKLSWGHYSGGRSFAPETQQYDYDFKIPITNTSDEEHIGIRSDLFLRVRRGRYQRQLQPIKFRSPYLGPNEPAVLSLHFSSIGELERIQDEEHEYVSLVITDSKGHKYEINLGEYST